MFFLYILGKAISVYGVARLTLLNHKEAIGRMAIMAHGGEFAFVLFSAATTAGVLSADLNATFTAAVIISMLFSPLIVLLLRRLSKPNTPVNINNDQVDGIDLIESVENSVVVLGFGRF